MSLQEKESLSLLKLQPKRVLQWAQTLTKPHPSDSVLTCARRFENPVTKLYKYVGMMQKMRLDFLQRIQTALGFLISSQPRRFCSQGCSVSSAHGAQTKVTLSYPPDSVKRCQRVSRNSQLSKYPPFSPNIPFILDVARFEIQHDAVVNHVCMSRQLCQAESECPLLVRLRPH